MRLTVQCRHRLGAFTLDASFSSEGGTTALFGRSGSGKTSLVNIIAGLLKPDEGRIVLDGEVLADSVKSVFLPPHRRRFGYVFQEARLFPHLSVRRNLNYGRMFAGRTADGPDFERIVDLLGLADLLGRAPANLSGGEKQRVALGRALLSCPRLLLMDEPLASLDEERKAEILPFLERLRDETNVPIIYVSHSIAEVAQLANRVVVLENGRVRAAGDVATVLSLPASSTAVGRRESGVLIEGTVEASADQLTTIRAGAVRIKVPILHLPTGKPVRLHVAARDVMLATVRPEGLSALNVLEGTVTEIGEGYHGMVDVRLLCGEVAIVSRITSLSRDMLGLRVGTPIHAVIKSVALDL